MSGWGLHRKEPRLRGVCAAASILLTAASSAHATPDIEFGRYLAQECVTCHRGAAPKNAIPNIYGMPGATFIQLIKAYREKRLDNAVMQNIAGRLKDDEIEALAAYFFITQP
jgi:cytochrome c553